MKIEKTTAADWLHEEMTDIPARITAVEETPDLGTRSAIDTAGRNPRPQNGTIVTSDREQFCGG